MNARKIDIYNHVMPRAVADLMLELAPSVSGMVKRVTSIPMLHDMRGAYPHDGDVAGLSAGADDLNPPLEAIAGPGDSPRLARLANDELKRICDTRPDKFPAWVASLPLNNVEAALAEMDRAIGQRRAGHPDLHERQRHAARRSVALPDLRACHQPSPRRESGCIRRATRGTPTIRARRNRNTKSGRSSAGPMRRASRWRASSFPVCLTDCPS